MPSRASVTMVEGMNPASNTSGERTKRRTPRACDRCRLKKAKCDGRLHCKSCKTSDSLCTYAARRGREARNYYARMRDITDEALQVLYRSCRDQSNFPGILPKEDARGCVSINAILEGLGLIARNLDDESMPQKLLSVSTHCEYPSNIFDITAISTNESTPIYSPSSGSSSIDSYMLEPSSHTFDDTRDVTNAYIQPRSKHAVGHFDHIPHSALSFNLPLNPFPLSFEFLDNEPSPSFSQLDGFFDMNDHLPTALTNAAE